MFQIDKLSHVPIYEQMIDQIERQISSGVLKAGDMLPSVRQLSQELAVNPNTLQKAYTELERRGVCTSVPGNGRFVSMRIDSFVQERKNRLVDELKETARELKKIGMSYDELIVEIGDVYGNKEGILA